MCERSCPPTGVVETLISERILLEIHVPQPHAVRDGVAELAVEERERVVDRLRVRAPVRTRLEAFKVRHVVALVHEQLAVQRRRGEVLAHLAVAAEVAPVVRVRGGQHVHARPQVEFGDRAVVAFHGPPLVLRVAVEHERRELAAGLLLHERAPVVEHVHGHAVVALEVVDHLPPFRRVAPAVRVHAQALGLGGHLHRLERGRGILEGGAQTRHVVPVLSAEILHERAAHRLRLVARHRTELLEVIGVPREILAPRAVRHVHAEQVASVFVDQVADEPAVVGRDLLARLHGRKRLARQVLPRDLHPGRHLGDELLVRVQLAPPVGRRHEEARQELRRRVPAQRRVELGVVVGRVERPVRAPVGMLVVRERAEHGEQVKALAGHLPHVRLLQLPLPEEERRHRCAVAEKPRRAIKVLHLPGHRRTGDPGHRARSQNPFHQSRPKLQAKSSKLYNSALPS